MRDGRTPTRCVLCGRDPAAGYAFVDDGRYCHGDDDPEPTCYMKAQAQLQSHPYWDSLLSEFGGGLNG